VGRGKNKLSFSETFGLTVFILVLFAGIYLSMLSLPGTVIIFIDVLIYAVVSDFDSISFQIIFLLLLFSVIAEGFEILSGMVGALRPLFSKQLFWASSLGAFAGAFTLTPLLWGLGTFGGFFLGCLGGILIVELIRQVKLQVPFKASNRAMFAMIGAKAIKGCLALMMIVLSLSNIYS